jgi:hypothetical protein
VATILQLVPSVGSTSPTLDLNTPGAGLYQLRTDPEPDFSPPPLRRATAGTLLADGQLVSASAYDNRTVRFTLRLLSATTGQKQTALTTLYRELDKEQAVLRLQFPDASASTWYRLLRSPTAPVRRLRPDGKALLVDLELLAEPFGLGAPVTAVSAATVNNDPAAGSNGCYLDVTGVTGDVEAPAKIQMSANSNNMAPILAVRRHGTVTDIAPIVQAESATQGTDTTTGADSAMSNGSRSRTSFATVSAMATRLTVDLPYSGGLPRTAARGTYHLFAMVASSASSNTFKIQMQVVSAFGGSIPMVTGVPVTYAATDTSRRLVDLGLLAVPVGPDPFYDGYGAEASVGSAQVLMQAQRVSGSGSLDWDYVAAMPADEEYMETATTYLDIVADGMQDVVYTPGGFGEVTAAAVPAIPRVSAIPMLTPNQTNRIYFLRPDGIGTGAVRGPDTKTRTAAVTITYNPCYLAWAP